MWKWIKSLLPFRMAYWVVVENKTERMLVIRQRMNPRHECEHGTRPFLTIDGPFDEQEDAARSLAFWRHQYRDDNTHEIDFD